MIEKESVEVLATSEVVKRDEASANEMAASAQALKDECESELAEAIPALEAALAALNTLKVRVVLVSVPFKVLREKGRIYCHTLTKGSNP